MSVNHVETACVLCGCLIPVNGGNDVQVHLEGLNLPGVRTTGYAHPACIEAVRNGDTTPQVTEIRTSGGTLRQNKKGRCLDAPCCGCCS